MDYVYTLQGWLKGVNGPKTGASMQRWPVGGLLVPFQVVKSGTLLTLAQRSLNSGNFLH